jgi:hypothetical protein
MCFFSFSGCDLLLDLSGNNSVGWVRDVWDGILEGADGKNSSTAAVRDFFCINAAPSVGSTSNFVTREIAPVTWDQQVCADPEVGGLTICFYNHEMFIDKLEKMRRACNFRVLPSSHIMTYQMIYLHDLNRIRTSFKISHQSSSWVITRVACGTCVRL